MPSRQFRIPLGRYLPPLGSSFVAVEALGGVVLLVATIAALIWANVSHLSYAEVWSTHLTVGPGQAAVTLSIREWINDGLMAVFFFVIGLEIKREIVRGELRDPRTASLPVIAALGGMVVPALVYATLNVGGPGAEGWGIPMATDIAFALALLVFLGPRIPPNLRLFLLTFAVVDDLGAIAVIAIFYSGSVSWNWLLGALAAVALILVLRRMGVRHALVYVLPALVLWVCVLESGIHPTVAGVVLGFLTPARPVRGVEIIEPLEARLHPWSSLVIVPLFALANAGVFLGAHGLERASESAVAWGIVLGLVIGKPLGIFAASLLAVRLRLSVLPEGVRRIHILAVGALAGIGFTVSLFVAELAFEGSRLASAKIGILVASLTSAIVGTIALRVTSRDPAGRDRRGRTPS